YTDRPLLDPSDDPGKILPLAEDAPGKRDLGRNGTYLVLRDLAQDVVRFWQFLDAQAQQDPHKRERLAIAMVGRMLADDAPVAGSPVIPVRNQANPGVASQGDEKRPPEEPWRHQDHLP